MKIKSRLSLYFSLICSLILLLGMIAVYLGFKKSVEYSFFERVKERNGIVASLYLEADEISVSELDSIKAHLFFKLPEEVYRIYDSRNQGVFIKDDQQYWSGKLIDEIRRKGFLQFKDGASQVVGKFYHDNQGDFVVIDSAVDVMGHQRLVNLRRILAMVFVLVILVLFMLTRFLATRLLSPIEALSERIQLIRASDLNLRIEPGRRKDEINELALSFNDLLERLERAFTLQGAFVSNVTHELRTPLTSIIGNIEVALLSEREAKHYKEVLQSVLDDAERLKATVAALLELAQVERNFNSNELQLVRIDELLWELQEDWHKREGSESMEIVFGEMPEDDQQLMVEANPQLLYIAINNLVANGFKYSDQKKVRCELSVVDHKIQIRIIDQGPGIAPEDQAAIFNPFYRAESTASKPGSGIGLYISQKITSLSKGELFVESSSSAGTVMSIQFQVILMSSDTF